MRTRFGLIILVSVSDLEIILIFRVHSSGSTASRIHVLLPIPEAAVGVATQSGHRW